MGHSNPRRDFIGKALLGLASFVALPSLASARSKKNTKNKKTMNAIKKIKPLGFQWETSDPFLFCAHHEDHYPKGNEHMGPVASMAGRHMGQDFIVKDGFRMYHGQQVPGFPGHPHRGFETITVVRKGFVDHADSLGAAGRYGNGDVQWMTAGKGVQHSEMFPLIHKDQDNPLELFQIWLNLPKKNKMVEPYFSMMWQETIPVIQQNDKNEKSIEIEVIAGQFLGKTAPTPPPHSWAAEPENHVGVYNIKMEAGSHFLLPKTEKGINRTIYFYQGSGLEVESSDIPFYHAVEVNPEMELEIKNTGNDEARLLILQGKPINEPVVQHGPFVMNTREEIREAFEEYHQTQFGGWPWPKYDQVHDRTKGRFARHADGREETRS